MKTEFEIYMPIVKNSHNCYFQIIIPQANLRNGFYPSQIKLNSKFFVEFYATLLKICFDHKPFVAFLSMHYSNQG